jgi:hypothetical protein
VDASGFFENQLTGGTWMTFDQSISGIRVQSIVTNFDGTWMHGSYIKVNGTVVASDHTLSPDGTNNSLAVGGSASFSGTGQYLSTNNASLNLTGDFTVEGWFYPTNVTGAHALWTFGQASAGRYTVQLSGTSVLSNLYGDGSTTYTSTVPINTWTHVAMVRSGTTVKIYINGTASATTDTQSGTIGNGGYLNIGADDSGATNFAGRITSFRVVNGTAVYTSNFTPSPNPLLPVINTKLLLTELTSSDLVADTGPNRLTLTNNGTVIWNSATPFTTGVTTTAPKDPSANQYGVGFRMLRGHTVVVLNPADGTIRSGWPKTYDTYGDPNLCTTMAIDLLAVAAGDVVAIGTFDATSCNQNLRDALTYLFGDTDYTNIWEQVRISHMFLGRRASLTSLSFNGTTDYKEITGTTSDWALGTTWTIEWWSKATSASTGGGTIYTVMSQYDNLGGIGIDIYYQNTKLVINNGQTLADEPTPGVWTHVAVINNAGSTKLYYNGIEVITAGYNNNLGLSTATLVLGRRGQIPYQYFNGKLTGIRITNTVVYTGTFDPYTVAFPPAKVTGTRLLLNPETFNLLDDLSDSNHGFGAGSVSNSTDYPVAPITHTALQSASNNGSNGVHLDTGTYDAWVGSVPVGATIVADGIGTSTVTSIYTPTTPGNPGSNWFFVVSPGTFSFPSGTTFTFTWTA